MLLSMLKIEHTKLYGRKVVWLELALVAALIGLLFGLIVVIQSSNEIPDAEKALISGMLTWPNGIRVALAVSSNQLLGALLMIVLVSMVVAQEYTWQTYSLAVRAGIPRSLALLSKFVVLLGPALLITVTALLVGTVMSGLLTLTVDGQLDFSRLNVVDLLVSTLTTAYSLLPYMALTFLITVLTRSLAASLGIAVGYVFLVEGIVPQILMLFGGLPAQLALYMPGKLASSLSNAMGQIAAIQEMGEGPVSATQFADPTVAVVGIGLYTLVFLVIAAIRFQKQDLTA
jgi:ABC-type transport system involved in multi-copper enzyme maturation permease subunit